MKKFIVLILALNMYLGVFAQFTPGDTLKYRISLKDKAATDYSLQKPEKYLSKKSIERRKKQGLPIDSTDLPVCRKYVDAIRKTGVHVLVTGKWDNFVTVSCNDSMLISEIAQLPFVRSTERVWKGITQRAFQRDSLINKPLRTDSLYGPAITQAAMSRVDLLHDAGFKGEGMTIAVIDAGFHNVDKIVFGFVEMIISNYVLDMVLNGNRQSVQFLIFSQKYDEIAERIIHDLDRGCTILDGVGGYSRKPVKVVVLLAKKSESVSIFRLVKQIDHQAFISQSIVRGVYGEGFDQIKT